MLIFIVTDVDDKNYYMVIFWPSCHQNLSYVIMLFSVFCWKLLILGPKLNNFEENLTRAKPKAVNRSASRARSSRTTSTVRIGTRVDDFI